MQWERGRRNAIASGSPLSMKWRGVGGEVNPGPGGEGLREALTFSPKTCTLFMIDSHQTLNAVHLLANETEDDDRFTPARKKQTTYSGAHPERGCGVIPGAGLQPDHARSYRRPGGGQPDHVV